MYVLAGTVGIDTLTVPAIDHMTRQVMGTDARALVRVHDGESLFQGTLAHCRDGAINAPRAR
jgi:hypothetical protein